MGFHGGLRSVCYGGTDVIAVGTADNRLQDQRVTEPGFFPPSVRHSLFSRPYPTIEGGNWVAVQPQMKWHAQVVMQYHQIAHLVALIAVIRSMQDVSS